MLHSSCLLLAKFMAGGIGCAKRRGVRQDWDMSCEQQSKVNWRSSWPMSGFWLFGGCDPVQDRTGHRTGHRTCQGTQDRASSAAENTESLSQNTARTSDSLILGTCKRWRQTDVTLGGNDVTSRRASPNAHRRSPTLALALFASSTWAAVVDFDKQTNFTSPFVFFAPCYTVVVNENLPPFCLPRKTLFNSL